MNTEAFWSGIGNSLPAFLFALPPTKKLQFTGYSPFAIIAMISISVPKFTTPEKIERRKLRQNKHATATSKLLGSEVGWGVEWRGRRWWDSRRSSLLVDDDFDT